MSWNQSTCAAHGRPQRGGAAGDRSCPTLPPPPHRYHSIPSAPSALQLPASKRLQCLITLCAISELFDCVDCIISLNQIESIKVSKENNTLNISQFSKICFFLKISLAMQWSLCFFLPLLSIYPIYSPFLPGIISDECISIMSISIRIYAISIHFLEFLIHFCNHK